MDFLGNYDVVVVGAGHAGIEAAHAAAMLGAKTAIFTLTLDFIGNMPCNPSHWRHSQGASGAGDRCAGRFDGHCGGCHLFTEPDAEPRQRPRGTQPARAD